MTAQREETSARPSPDGVPLLSLRGVNKSFGAVHVLQDVDFDAYEGQVTALVGDNGAGKSTLIKGIAGIYAFDSGDYLFEGRRVTVNNPKQANALGIEVVYQDLALCDNLDIVHNLFLGRELTKRGQLDEDTMERRATETLASLSVRTVKSVRQHVASLSGGQRQTVAIARSVIWNSRVVILDEPTAADEVSVLYLGKIAAQLKVKDVTRNQVVELITSGRSGADEPAAAATSTASSEGTGTS
jgi:D-xylose transport system ATP-binding protein